MSKYLGTSAIYNPSKPLPKWIMNIGGVVFPILGLFGLLIAAGTGLLPRK